MKFNVFGYCNIICSMVVEANTEAEAIEKANENFGGLCNYCGNSGTDKLIGPTNTEDECAIFPDSDPEFDDAAPI